MVSCRLFEWLVIFLRIESHGCWQFPVPGVPVPPMGIAELGCGVDGLALVPDGQFESAVALLRRDKLEGTVLVFACTSEQTLPPSSGPSPGSQSLLADSLSILADAVDGLGKGVVVADVRTTFEGVTSLPDTGHSLHQIGSHQ